MTRKEFLRLMVAGLGTLASGYWLGACAPQPPAATPAPVQSPTAAATVQPTLTPFFGRPSIVKMYPEGPSRIVHIRHAGAWSSDKLVPGALRQMLDAGITRLTGLNDAKAAWGALFKPSERIAIKVNTFSDSGIWTHAPLVATVTQCLQDAGIPAQQIVVYDHFTHELSDAGYTVNRDGPGARCYGSDDNHSSTFQVSDVSVNLSDVLSGSDAVINMPILKVHGATGITFALKNHFGSTGRPVALHGGSIERRMVALAALPPIRERTRLIIGDILTAAIKMRNAYPAWQADVIGDAVLMGFDPVAVDTIGVQILSQLRAEKGEPPAGTSPVTAYSLPLAAALGLGTDRLDQIDLAKVNLP